MFHRPKQLFPQLINREQMRSLTASLLYDGIRERIGLKDVRISIRGVRPVGPGQFIPATESEIVADTQRTLDEYVLPEFDLYIIEGTYDSPKANPSLRMTRADFLVDLLDRLEGLRESLKYSPALYENVSAEIEIASHYVKGAFDIAELADLEYLEGQGADLPVSL